MSNIFFRAPEGDWNGPRTEKEVQDWYRQKWFTNQYEFLFTDDDQMPGKDAKGTTLSELKKHNGVCSVFQPIDSTINKSKEIEKQLIDAQKNIESFRETSNFLSSLESRVETIENTIKDLKEKSILHEDNIPSKKITERVNFGKYAYLLIRVLAAMEVDEFARMPEFNEEIDMAEREIQSDEQKKELLEVLSYMLKTRGFTFCLKCNLFMQKPKHAIMHLVVSKRPHQHKQEKGLNYFCDVLQRMLLGTVQHWFDQEREFSQLLKNTYANISPTSYHLFPSSTVAMQLGQVHQLRITQGEPGVKMREAFLRIASHVQQFVDEFYVLTENKMTRCMTCNIVTGTVENFLKHITTYEHITYGNGWSYTDAFTCYMNFAHKNEE